MQEEAKSAPMVFVGVGQMVGKLIEAGNTHGVRQELEKGDEATFVRKISLKTQMEMYIKHLNILLEN